jgi:hypothetical protein
MLEGANTSSNQQIYNVHSADSLMTQVVQVICVLMPRGLIVAGFSERGDLLMIRYNDYKKSLPTWILDFYEHQFINEPLLSQPEKITAAFVASDKGFIVPEVLYDATTAEKWMKKIHFVEGSEVMAVHHLREDGAYYMFAWPAAIKSLMIRYFPKARIYPFATYQFYKPYKSESSLQCCITSEQVFATLYSNRNLAWHQIFSYETAEDIAYHIKLLCQKTNLDPEKVTLQCTMTSKGLYNTLSELTQYFPDLKDGSGNVGANDRTWTGAIHLLQQLYACAL